MTASHANGTSNLTNVTPNTLESWLQSGSAVLIDVREDFEHAEERIDGAVLHPLSKFDPDTIRKQHNAARVVFQCRSGKRSAEAAQRYARTDEASFHLAGGIEEWKTSGHTVINPSRPSRIPIMRQVQITAGLLVAISVTLGVTVSPWFLAVAGFVGCGLVFAGVSGWCGMAKLLAAMPWNRRPSPTT